MVAILLALLGPTPSAVGPAAAAGAGWYDGLIKYSTITNCASIIFGNPYQEQGAAVYTGFYANPDSAQPAPNQTYYLHVIAYGLGNACSGMRIVPEIQLPANTSLAITAGTPVYCFAGGVQDTVNCPQSLPPSSFNPGAYWIPSPDTANAQTWPLPQGGNWEFQIPVKSSTALSNASFKANVMVLDGESSPWLMPTASVWVFDASPTIYYPSPSTTDIGKTAAKSWAYLYSAGVAGNAYFELGTTTSYGLVTDGPIAIPTSGTNWQLWDDWTPFPLQPDTLYHWRLKFQVTGTGQWIYGPDQTFRTLGAAATFQVTGVGSGGAAGAPASVTVTVKDATGAVATSYRGKIHFTSSDANAVLPADYTFTAGDNGAHTFTNGVAMMTQGTHEVRATATSDPLLTGAQTGITVTSTNPPPNATLTRPAAKTKATTLTYGLTFSESVTGLTASDFSRTGTATGCVVGAPTGSGASYSVPVSNCSQGTVVLTLKANTVADNLGALGPDAAVKAGTVTIDRTAPTATAPKASLRSNVALSGTALPIRLTWTGSDSGGAGIARYELAKSTDGGTTWTVVSTTITGTTRDLTVAASGTVRFRVRAVDAAGNLSGWQTGPVLTPRLIQETAGSIAYGGAWTSQSSTSFSGGSVRYATAAGASATYAFTGRSVAFVSTMATNRGAVRIYVDGVLAATIDLSAASTQYRRVIWQRTWASAGAHSVRIEVVGTSGRPRIDVDAFAVLQ